jgi:transporter family-2 protein
MQPTHFYALTMLAAGIGIPVLAALNAQLGSRLGSPVAAAVVLFCVALLTSLVVLAMTGPGPILALAGAPRHLMLAGLLVAFYILSITFIAPHFGVGNAVFFVLLGQLISAALIVASEPVKGCTTWRCTGSSISRVNRATKRSRKTVRKRAMERASLQEVA